MTIKRVHYREDQRLKQEDLQDEQAYQIAARRRHNIAHHGWGIVEGLELVADVPGVIGIVVNPGFAIDGYGRELIVPEAMILDDDVFNQILDDSVDSEHAHYFDIWLTYCLRQLAINPDGSDSREAEEALLKINCTSNDNVVDPRYPWEVSLADLDFPPHRDAPDDPEREWPVYIGRVSAQNRTEYSIVSSEFKFVDSIGSTIRSPWGVEWMKISNEERGDRKRFSLRTHNSNSEVADRFELDRSGNIGIYGEVEVANLADIPDTNDLILKGQDNELAYGGGIHFSNSAIEPQLAEPWSMYKANIETTVNDVVLPIEQLRIEVLNPGENGDPSRQSFDVVGRSQFEESVYDANEKDYVKVLMERYQSLLKIRADNKVIVEGNLKIEGQLIEGPIPFDLDDKRFKDAMLANWTEGLTIAGTEVEAYYDTDLVIEPIVEESSLVFPPEIDENITLLVTIKHNGLTQRIVPVIEVIGEIKDASQNMVYKSRFTIKENGLPSINLYPPDNPHGKEFSADATLFLDLKNVKATGPVTIIAKVKTVNASNIIVDVPVSEVAIINKTV